MRSTRAFHTGQNCFVWPYRWHTLQLLGTIFPLLGPVTSHSAQI
jgi:hypothetical protein